MMKRCLLLAVGSAALFAQPPVAPPKPPRQAAPIDITGYWVSLVTEDWRFRMVTPPKGDYPGMPMNAAGKKIADSWDPAADTAAGEACRNYGAGAIMRVPGRLHITWQDDTTLKVEADAGTQTRLFKFGGAVDPNAAPTWQGQSIATWELQQGGGRGVTNRRGNLKVVTTRMKMGYIHKNGVPYSANATVTEYIDLLKEADGNEYLLVKTIVNDPTYLTQEVITSSNFKKQADAKGWNPSACEAQ
jgi:hypothetical protein